MKNSNFKKCLNLFLFAALAISLQACSEAEENQAPLNQPPANTGEGNPPPADVQGPFVTSRTPEGFIVLGSNETSREVTLRVVFNEAVVLTRSDDIGITGMQSPQPAPEDPTDTNFRAIYSTYVELVPTTVSVDPQDSAVLLLKATLREGMNYNVQIGEGSVKDASGNEGQAFTWSFSVEGQPNWPLDD